MPLVGAVVLPLAATYGQSEDVTPVLLLWEAALRVWIRSKVLHSSAATNPESAAASDVPFGLSHRRGFLRPQLKSQKWTGKYGDLLALGCHLQTQPPRLSDGLLNG